ncbi:BAH_G0016320.mRNA.1.CDS.1 [Saccharomyces cerevisiae]|nr:SX2_G0049720.mRNA.1.CDS.1 [Saccharomyces cerevisiae]CAI4450753.1 BAG_1a_G0016450.mRNA.1.CDS.1 [Saccharomyces cerevisiae]CAI4454356.1 BAH_G0016320.mRNA.1.CDS.1 [Saccharomyces cerevisiae]CAI7111677.1 BAH_G0016320.mRNA.1.CDS.1 [Saccharomyces cerevisiae]CAI7112005.1 BAG_1a_G0016450.mRNA.1.CDS.1 [Saccharomyces cerevisiae]
MLKCVKNGGTVKQVDIRPSNENYDDGDYSLAIDLMSRDCINVYEWITDRLLVDFLSKKLLKLR